MLLKADLLEDVDAYAKFVDSVGKVIVPSDSFAKRLGYSRRFSLLAIMHKTLILVVESMRVDQYDVKCAKKVEVALTVQLRLAAEKIEKLEYELTIFEND